MMNYSPEFAGAIATIAGAFQGRGQQSNSVLLSYYFLQLVVLIQVGI